MYQENEMKQLYERLKAQYPRCSITFSGDSLILNRVHGKVEINRDGVRLYADGKLYDQISSEDVSDSDDLYELIELFLLEMQYAGMKEGNETYIAAAKQAAKMGSRFLIGIAICFTIVMIGLIITNSPWLFLLVFLIPAVSIVVLKQIRKKVFQRYWVCPSCSQSLPMKKKGYSCEMEYVPQCPYCGQILEQPPELEPIQMQADTPREPLESLFDAPAPISKWPCVITGIVTVVIATLFLPMIFIANENASLDAAGIWVGVVLLLLLLGFGFLLMFCRHTEPEETQRAIVVVRERKMITVIGIIIWVLSLVVMLAAVIVAGTPPFDAMLTFVIVLFGLPLLILALWMMLAGRNRVLFVFQDNSVLYISSWGKEQKLAPNQVASVRLTSNQSIHLLNKEGKKLAAVESNMRGVSRFLEWIESTNLDVALSNTMEKQAKQEEQQESTVQWREEYHTSSHDHIKSIRLGMWGVIAFFALGVLAPVPLYLLGVKFTTVMKIGALAPIPFLIFCLVFAPVLLFQDRPKNATPEWNAMHVKVPVVLVMLIGLIYISQVHYLWDGWILQEVNGGLDWLVRVSVIAMTLTALLILRTPKRTRPNARFYMAVIGIFSAIGLHYCVNAAFIGPAQHYPAVVADSHANDDDYELTVLMKNGEETDLAVTKKIYEMAVDGLPLEICHRESPFGVVLLDIHVPQGE